MKDLHICLNMAGDSGWMGGVLYTQNLVRAIASLPEEEKAHIKLTIAAAPSNLNLVEPVRDHLDQIYIKERLYLKVGKELAERFHFLPRKLLNPLKVDFLYPTSAMARTPYLWGGWIPDFQHHYLPELFSEEEINARNNRHQRMAEVAPVIILSSKMAQDDFNRLYPEAASRSRLMNFVSYPEPEWFKFNPQLIQEKYGLPERFFLVSNQFWKHKNHKVVIEALGILKQQKITPTVVCTGKTTEGSQYFNQLITRIEELGIGNQVRILGLIPRLDQIQLMRRCLAVIQPSLFEGWSTVIEDGRALGKPMLVSDFPVHLEQNPPHTHFFERSNPEQLASLIFQGFSTLQPGSDLEKENQDRHKNSEAIVAYGRRFMEIVNDVV
ncbi:MAG: glycosyltransferase family 4 protein [Symploca sp. SIO2E9]|nr:glycosyltransferase family 4 protein [Symploca sp. SIO2E9]